MVAPLLVAAIIGPAIAQLVSGPLTNTLSTVIPHETVAIRAALRMVANGAMTPQEFATLDSVKSIVGEERKILVRYAHTLAENRAEIELREVQSPLLKEGVQVFKKLDDYDSAEFLGALDDSQKKIREVEAELERLDRAEKDAWLKEELGFNSLLVRIVEDRIKAAARSR